MVDRPFVRRAQQGDEVVLHHAGRREGEAQCENEDNQHAPAGEALDPALPAGRYRLRADDETESALIVAPSQCWSAGDDRVFGLSAQLYALRRDGDQGIGDFTTLSRLAQKCREAGAALVAINPLHALFPQDRMRASPYYPSDRRFLDPLGSQAVESHSSCMANANIRSRHWMSRSAN